jgi:hypothetical protein
VVSVTLLEAGSHSLREVLISDGGFALTRTGLTIPAVATVVIFSAFLLLAVVP